MQNEGFVLKKINSLYVVKVKCYGNFVENSKMYIVMQYCPNGTLRHLIKHKKKKGSSIDEEFIWEIFLKISLGLGALHTNKIIHRDLKPENIFMYDKNIPKIGDTQLLNDLSSNNQSNNLSGTVKYLSPEVFNSRFYNEKSDIWSLGCILYELSTLKLPFNTIYEILSKNPEKIARPYSKDLQNIILQMLEKELDKRPSLFELLNNEITNKKLKELNLFDEAIELFPDLKYGSFFPKLKEIGRISNEKIRYIDSICFLADGRLVITDGRTILICDKQTFETDIMIEGCYSSLYGLKNGNLATSHLDKSIAIFHINKNNYQIIQILEHTLNRPRCRLNLKVIELKDGKLCSYSFNGVIKIWDQNSYQCIQTLIEDTFYLTTKMLLCFCILEIKDYLIMHAEAEYIEEETNYDDSTHISLLSENSPESGYVRILNKFTYECIKTMQNIHCSFSHSISKLNDNSIIIGRINEIQILNTSFFQLKSFKDQRLGSIEYILVLKENEIFLGNEEGEIICYDSLSNQIISIQKSHISDVKCIAKGEDNKIISASYNSIKVFSIKSY